MATTMNEISNKITCRFCLTDTTEHPLPYFLSDDQDKYDKMLEDTFKIQVYLSDNKSICCECQDNVCSATEFKRRVLAAQKTLEQNEELKLSGDAIPKKEIDMDFNGWEIGNNIEMKTGDGASGNRTSGNETSGKKTRGKRSGETKDSMVAANLQCNRKRLKISCTKNETYKTSPEISKQEIDSDYDDCHFDCIDDSVKMGLDRTKSNGTGSDGTRDIDIGDNGPKVDGTKDNGMGDNGTGVDETKGNCNRKMQNGAMKNSKTVKKPVVKIERMKKLRPQKLPQDTPVMKKLLSNKNLKVNRIEKKDETNSSETDEHIPKTSECLKRMKDNTVKLINYSNVCIFVPKKSKYGCHICNQSFLDIEKLRSHAVTHDTNNIYRIICANRGMSRISVEISNLECTKCSHPCPDLNELRVHLKNDHDVSFDGVEHLLLPFQIENGFKCAICHKEFTCFLSLSVHMHSHSTSNVCEICGSAFINRRNLRNHINARHKVKECTICNVVLPSTAAKLRHLRNVHKKGQVKRYCRLCDMVFPYAYRLNDHMVEKHGAKKTEVVCESCNKVFGSPLGLRTHFKSVHLGERKHLCGVCDMSFFTSTDRKRHEMTHGDSKPYSCDACNVRFRSKDSIKRHLKKKHGKD